MATVIYEIPNSVKEMFEQGENSYRIIDYSINEMDNHYKPLTDQKNDIVFEPIDKSQ